MKYSINKIYIENFKFIEEGNLDFENSNLVILDGPNGYGKTTIFDIIELAITGRINRINSNQTDNSSGCEDILYLKEQSKDAIIKVEFISKDDKFTVVKRIDATKNYTKRDKKSNNWNLFETYLLKNFNDRYCGTNKIEPKEIMDLFGEDYLDRFYNLFYYIQQEDSSYFLKQSEKQRVDVLSKLFNVEKEKDELKKLEQFRTKITETISTLNKSKIIYDDSINPSYENEQLKYNCIISWKNIDWDRENLTIKSKAQLEEYRTQLENIRLFNKYSNEFFENQINEKIDFYIQNEDILKSYIVCRKFLEQYDEIEKKYKDMKFILSAKNIYNIMDVEQIHKLNYKRLISIIGSEDKDTLLYSYEENIKKLDKFIENESHLEKHIASINQNRELLKVNNIEVDKEIRKLENNRCLLCGNPYDNKKKLDEAIDKYTQHLDSIMGESSILNKNNIKTIKDMISSQILIYIDKYTKESDKIIEEKFYIQLEKYMKIYKENTDIVEVLNKVKVDESLYLNHNHNEIVDLDEKCEALKQLLKLKKYRLSTIYEVLNKDLNFNNIYRFIFDRDRKKLEKINLELIDNKIRYINNKYYNNEISKIKHNANIDKKVVELEEVKEKLNSSIEIYRTGIRNHYTKIIKDIEIPFYIYSGKILQDYQRGLGIFIKEYEELKNLKFVSNDSSDHDAINYLSSGQLSALVISFTLALNKVYGNKNINTILIDDPVQTMDDINMMSFIELIRNEFRDKQIIISTHQDEVSLFMRYKFLMHNLKQTRVNVKQVLR